MAHSLWHEDVEQLLHEMQLVPCRIKKSTMAVDVYEDPKNIFIEAHIPDINPEKVDINIKNDQLKISGSRDEKKELKDKHYHIQEIKRGSFERIITLPCEIQEQKATAEFQNGVLKITLPKKEATTGEHKVKIGNI